MAEVMEATTTLETILGTDDPKQQVTIVGKLLEMVNARVLTMTVSLDTRTGKMDILLNGKYTYEEIYALIDASRREVNRREREDILKQPPAEKS